MFLIVNSTMPEILYPFVFSTFDIDLILNSRIIFLPKEGFLLSEWIVHALTRLHHSVTDTSMQLTETKGMTRLLKREMTP